MERKGRSVVGPIQRYIRRYENEFCQARTLQRACAVERKWTGPGGVIEAALREYRPLKEGSEGGRKVFQSYLFRHIRGRTRDFRVLFEE